MSQDDHMTRHWTRIALALVIITIGVLLWHLRLEWNGAALESIEHAEKRVHRFIGGTFFALTLYVLGQAGWTLWQQETPGESMLGILLTLASLIIMPLNNHHGLGERAPRNLLWISQASDDRTTRAIAWAI